MNKATDLFRRGYEFLIAGTAALQAPFLLVLRLYFFWQLILTGKGKLFNIGKVSGYFASLGIPLPTLNAYFIRIPFLCRLGRRSVQLPALRNLPRVQVQP
jgi:uncharacterized membrane protein YphA (DoxX/SURF4 family)